MQPNQSPEPTAVRACRSDIAVRVNSRRWLSVMALRRMRGLRFFCYSAACFALCDIAFHLLRQTVPQTLSDSLGNLRSSWTEQLPETHSNAGLLGYCLLFVLSLAGGVFWFALSLLWAITDHTHEERD